MTKEEYLAKKKIIEADAKAAIDKLAGEYALSNAKHKEGDVIQDHIGFGKVEKLQWKYKSFQEDSEVVYICVELKKDLTPVKKNTKRMIYACNLINQ